MNSRIRDYATTLLLGIISRDWIALLQVGDGMIVIDIADERYQCPIPGYQDNQYVNETHFITDSDYKTFTRLAVISAAGVQGLALLTDGLQIVASDMVTQQPFQPFFKPLFAFASRPGATDAELEGLPHVRTCLPAY